MDAASRTNPSRSRSRGQEKHKSENRTASTEAPRSATVNAVDYHRPALYKSRAGSLVGRQQLSSLQEQQERGETFPAQKIRQKKARNLHKNYFASIDHTGSICVDRRPTCFGFFFHRRDATRDKRESNQPSNQASNQVTRKRNGNIRQGGKRVCDASKTRLAGSPLWPAAPLRGTLPIRAGVDYPSYAEFVTSPEDGVWSCCCLPRALCYLRHRLAAALHSRYIADSAVETSKRCFSVLFPPRCHPPSSTVCLQHQIPYSSRTLAKDR